MNNEQQTARVSLGETPTLEALHAAGELKARYFYYVDTRQFDKLRELFTEDAVIEGYAWANPGDREDFMTGVKEFLEGITSVHQGYMPMITQKSEKLLRARWSMYDYLTWETGSKQLRGKEQPDLSGLRGYGHYEDEYRLAEDGWRISFMRLTRLRVDLIEGASANEVGGGPAGPPRNEWIS